MGSPLLAESKAYLDAQEEARKDVKSETIKYLLYGMPHAQDRMFASFLKKKYNITLVIVAGCIVTQEIRDRADGYNKVIFEYLKKKYKENVIEEAEEKARKQWEQENSSIK